MDWRPIPQNIVIPAQAGIQSRRVRVGGGSWIPAFAGMTLSALAFAQSGPEPPVGYSTHPKVPVLVETLRHDFSFSDGEIFAVVEALKQAQRLPQLVELEQKAPEKTQTWTQYSIRIDESRVRDGVQLLRDYREVFARAEAEFGVPPAIVAAVMGVETRYGKVPGKIRVLDSLATQGFDHPTRSAFFFGELAQFFAFCRDFGFAPEAPQGSYAGAMGAAQFMPSNYRRLALDYDADGKRDLWTLADAIGSIANYLTSYKPELAWRRGEPVAMAAHVVEGRLPVGAEVNGKAPLYYAGDLTAAGIVSEPELPPATLAGLISLELDGGASETWLALPNFYSVMAYNPRTYYAMSVTQLASRIERRYAAEAAP